MGMNIVVGKGGLGFVRGLSWREVRTCRVKTVVVGGDVRFVGCGDEALAVTTRGVRSGGSEGWVGRCGWKLLYGVDSVADMVIKSEELVLVLVLIL